MAKKSTAVQQTTPVAPAAPVLVLGAKAPKHRAGHTAAAWAALSAKLPATAAQLAALPELQVPQCGGPKGNGLLFVSYAVRRGWLTTQA